MRPYMTFRAARTLGLFLLGVSFTSAASLAPSRVEAEPMCPCYQPDYIFLLCDAGPQTLEQGLESEADGTPVAWWQLACGDGPNSPSFGLALTDASGEDPSANVLNRCEIYVGEEEDTSPDYRISREEADITLDAANACFSNLDAAAARYGLAIDAFD